MNKKWIQIGIQIKRIYQCISDFKSLVLFSFGCDFKRLFQWIQELFDEEFWNIDFRTMDEEMSEEKDKLFALKNQIFWLLIDCVFKANHI